MQQGADIPFALYTGCYFIFLFLFSKSLATSAELGCGSVHVGIEAPHVNPNCYVCCQPGLFKLDYSQYAPVTFRARHAAVSAKCQQLLGFSLLKAVACQGLSKAHLPRELAALSLMLLGSLLPSHWGSEDRLALSTASGSSVHQQSILGQPEGQDDDEGL